MSLFKDKLELGIEEAELSAQKKLNSFSPLLRWMLVVIIIAIIPAYFISKFVSNKYWTGKYNQYILTAKQSFTNPLAPKISDILLFGQGSENFAALVTVTNNNLDLSLNETPYKINFYNNSDERVYSVSDKIYLLPNQAKDIVVPKFTTSEKIVSAQMEIDSNLRWQKRAQVPQVKLLASQPDNYTQYEPLAFVAEGNIYNDSPYSIKQIHLTFKAYNSLGKIIAISQRDEFSVAPFERRAYKQLWPGMYATDVRAVMVNADTNVLDPANLTLPDQQTTPASDLNR